MPLRRRKRPAPDPALAGGITEAMRAGNGKGIIVRDRNELVQRLREDQVEFKISDVLTVLSQMIEDGRIERRPGIGMWLGNGSPSSERRATPRIC